MIQRLVNAFALARNMGPRYIVYRTGFELRKRAGLLHRHYPTDVPRQRHISLADWKTLPARFFFESRETLRLPRRPTTTLRDRVARLRAGEFPYFNAGHRCIGTDYDWLTNPDSGFRYDGAAHWLDVDDFAAAAGDIKFVWEKSRFSYLHTIVRYDYHFEEDCAEWVFGEIDSWLSANPINRGPNYKCSQEISLRVLNWLWVLYYYQNSPALTEDRFQRIMHACYWQLHHVRQNIDFSRIAVRNNHAITETMLLYLGGIFFPFFPEAEKWAKAGKDWLEEEVAYQVYPDGTFLQFSHNYHRVLVQLLTWTLYLSRLNNQPLSATFLDRSRRSLDYLYQCQVEENGRLPNYGANDGALFFPLSDCAYRDYRPALNALAYYFYGQDLYTEGGWLEDRQWYTARGTTATPAALPERRAIASYSDGGYYIARNRDTLTFIRCGSHRDRPSHADNLHLDLWYKGVNYLRDAGTYKYNTDPETLTYFVGTKGHNTVQLGHHDQMRKGARFIWYDWSQATAAAWISTPEAVTFRGEIRAFGHVQSGIRHAREVRIDHSQPEWQIRDTVHHQTGLPLRQVWNVHPDFRALFSISATTAAGSALEAQTARHWYSSEYGERTPSEAIIFTTTESAILTTITLR